MWIFPNEHRNINISVFFISLLFFVAFSKSQDSQLGVFKQLPVGEAFRGTNGPLIRAPQLWVDVKLHKSHNSEKIT